MRRVDIVQTQVIIFPPNAIKVFILLFSGYREYGHSGFKFLGVGCVVLREVRIYIASQCMPISAESYISLLVMMSVDDLLFDAGGLVFALKVRGGQSGLIHSLIEILFHPGLLLYIELLFSDFALLLFLLFKLILRVPNLIAMGFDELVIFLHDCVHVRVIYIYIIYLLSFLQSVVIIIQSQFFCECSLEFIESFLFVELGSFAIVDGCGVCLIVLWGIGIGVWVDVECFEVITVYDSAHGLMSITSTIGLQCGFPEVLLEFRVGEISGKWYHGLDIVLYFFPILLFLFSLLLCLLGVELLFFWRQDFDCFGGVFCFFE